MAKSFVTFFQFLRGGGELEKRVKICLFITKTWVLWPKFLCENFFCLVSVLYN